MVSGHCSKCNGFKFVGEQGEYLVRERDSTGYGGGFALEDVTGRVLMREDAGFPAIEFAGEPVGLIV